MKYRKRIKRKDGVKQHYWKRKKNYGSILFPIRGTLKKDIETINDPIPLHPESIDRQFVFQEGAEMALEMPSKEVKDITFKATKAEPNKPYRIVHKPSNSYVTLSKGVLKLENPAQANNYIENKFGGSKAFKIARLKK